MRYTFKDLVEMVPSHKRSEFTKIYEYIHKIEDADGDDLLQKVSKHFVVATSDIKSDKRLADIVLARQVFMTTVKICTTKTLAEVARLIDKDHATVCHAIKTIKRDYEYNQVRRNKIRNFIADLEPAKQELLLDFFNERDPHILAAYAVDPNRIGTSAESEA